MITRGAGKSRERRKRVSGGPCTRASPWKEKKRASLGSTAIATRLVAVFQGYDKWKSRGRSGTVPRSLILFSFSPLLIANFIFFGKFYPDSAFIFTTSSALLSSCRFYLSKVSHDTFLHLHRHHEILLPGYDHVGLRVNAHLRTYKVNYSGWTKPEGALSSWSNKTQSCGFHAPRPSICLGELRSASYYVPYGPSRAASTWPELRNVRGVLIFPLVLFHYFYRRLSVFGGIPHSRDLQPRYLRHFKALARWHIWSELLVFF